MKLDRNFWLKLSLESLLIIFSVLLALALNEYLASRKEAEKTRQVLLSIREELRENREIIKNWQQIHTETLKNIEFYRSQPTTYDSLMQGNQFRFNLIFKGSLMPNNIRSNAWEIAKTSGMLQNFDLALANTLTDTYDMQHIGAGSTANQLIRLIYDRQTHEQALIPQTLVIFEITMQELVGQEAYLLTLYEKVLKELDTALET